MKLNFDPNQDYQLDAIKAIVDVFEGQPLYNEQLIINNAQLQSSNGSTLFNEYGIGNNLEFLRLDQLGNNIRNVQLRNGISPLSNDEIVNNGWNFSI
jgi:type III restriction enzyme